MATVVKADGTKIEVQPQHGTAFTLEEMQGFVGGLIELIELSRTEHLYLNEEGMLLGLPLNRWATAHTSLPIHGDVIVGPRQEVSD